MQIGLDYQYKNSDVNETIQNETQNNKQNMKLIPTQLQHANDNENNNNINNDKQHQVINIMYNNKENEKKQGQNNDINNNINNNIFGNNIDHKIINQTNKENYISQKQEEDSSKFNNISVDYNSNNITFNSGFLCMNIQLQCLILKEKLDIQYVQKEKKCKKCLQYKEQIKAIDEQIVQFKKCFLASSLHSLRTPLNISSNFLGVAKDMHEISQEIRENYLIPAYCSNEILSSAINDFQDYIMIDTKQFELNIEEIDFNNLLKYVLMIFSPEQAIRNIPINVVIEASEKIIFNNDSQRITQIFINLLQNAIRNCNGGEIKIQVQNQSQKVIVKVTDSGEIYDDKLQDSVYQDIFNERKTGQENEDDILRGNPLGLQISNKLAVELSKGKMLEIQTSKTFGNSITFELYKFENSSDSKEKKLKNFQKQLSHANFNLVYQDWFQTDNGNISQDSINQISEVDEEQNSQTLNNGNLQKSKSSTATNFNQNNQMSSSYGGNNNQITIKMKEKKLARISTTITKNHKIIQRFNTEEMRNSDKNQKQYKSLLQEQNKHLQQLREMQMQKPKGNKNFINSQLNKVLKSIHESNNETSQGHHKPESSYQNSNIMDSQASSYRAPIQ
ncbi:Signal transduction histidine kinase, homodimeric domain [Pseudocohnilembus persalinus]|uniref:Signal transduction histidine kinase, homodimeric domain n=1 Tax=Pseudocohnilembus persalinus TaxID=266149 RepID=A0A0V0QRV6_PSEPJ|nr:Signal transduction histidine kinase, homodimeric domain [Pseudocohnilembus persalinus]|eukprot:KRX04855.1 Signal transduction histidine kinase, homodimeric domain [Pseudocohnilembus persalinus]